MTDPSCRPRIVLGINPEMVLRKIFQSPSGFLRSFVRYLYPNGSEFLWSVGRVLWGGGPVHLLGLGSGSRMGPGPSGQPRREVDGEYVGPGSLMVVRFVPGTSVRSDKTVNPSTFLKSSVQLGWGRRKVYIRVTESVLSPESWSVNHF